MNFIKLQLNLKVILHEKNCNTNNLCKVSVLKSNAAKTEISRKILKVAAIYKKEGIQKLSEELGEYQVTTPKTKRTKKKK